MLGRGRRFVFTIGAIASLGCGLLVLPALVRLPGGLRDVIPALGTALLVAAILGATVDAFLKQRLLQDAFVALFDYLLPETLRGELGWISEQEFLFERYDFTLTLTPIDDSDLLRASLELQRDLLNITSHTAYWRPCAALDEWFHKEHPSRITALYCTQDGATRRDTKINSNEPFMVVAESDWELTFKPRERIAVVFEGEETKHRSDAMFLNIAFASVNPRITVHAPTGVTWRVMFGNRQQGQLREIGPNTRELPGTLLPGQTVQIRWWQENDVDTAALGSAALNGKVDNDSITIGTGSRNQSRSDVPT